MFRECFAPHLTALLSGESSWIWWFFLGTLDHSASDGLSLVFRLWIFEVVIHDPGPLYDVRFFTFYSFVYNSILRAPLVNSRPFCSMKTARGIRFWLPEASEIDRNSEITKNTVYLIKLPLRPDKAHWNWKFRCWRMKSYGSRRRCERLTRYLICCVSRKDDFF